MNQQNHQEYYVERAATSRQLAQRAADPAIAAIHIDLATRYEALAGQSEPTIVSVLTRVQAS